jgi:hypothetical protein
MISPSERVITLVEDGGGWLVFNNPERRLITSSASVEASGPASSIGLQLRLSPSTSSATSELS